MGTPSNAQDPTSGSGPGTGRGPRLEILAVSLRLGLTSFGGPIAHLGYFRDAYVVRRGWLDEATFADLAALGQALPGPTSSQVGMAIGILRGGLAGGLLAWFGFTLPSAVLMLAFGALAAGGVPAGFDGLVAGLKVAAVAVVAAALLAMARTLAPDGPRRLGAIGAALLVLAVPLPATQLLVIALGAVLGWLVLRGRVADRQIPGSVAAIVDRRWALVAGALFVGLLVGLPVVAANTSAHAAELAWAAFRAGALVFGGGHVVLPLLESTFVGAGWLTEDAFLAGYGAAQALPGPLFTFAGYLGAAQAIEPSGIPGGLLAIAAIFLPGSLLLVAVLPAWDRLRRHPRARAALGGIEASVVGILGAALWDPVIRSGIAVPGDAVVAALGAAGLVSGRVPPLAVVALSVAWSVARSLL